MDRKRADRMKKGGIHNVGGSILRGGRTAADLKFSGRGGGSPIPVKTIPLAGKGPTFGWKNWKN